MQVTFNLVSQNVMVGSRGSEYVGVGRDLPDFDTFEKVSCGGQDLGRLPAPPSSCFPDCCGCGA